MFFYSSALCQNRPVIMSAFKIVLHLMLWINYKLKCCTVLDYSCKMLELQKQATHITWEAGKLSLWHGVASGCKAYRCDTSNLTVSLSMHLTGSTCIYIGAEGERRSRAVSTFFFRNREDPYWSVARRWLVLSAVLRDFAHLLEFLVQYLELVCLGILLQVCPLSFIAHYH